MYKRQEGDYKVPGGMVITGGASKLAGLPEYLKDKFGGELSVKQVSPAFFSDGGNQELTANPEFHSLYAMLYVANVDVARTEEEPSAVEQHEEQHEEPAIHIVEGEADIMSQPGVLPFDEEDLKPQADPAPRVKPRRERTPKPKKAVSYTHLDVYKRQIVSLWRIVPRMRLPTTLPIVVVVGRMCRWWIQTCFFISILPIVW